MEKCPIVLHGRKPYPPDTAPLFPPTIAALPPTVEITPLPGSRFLPEAEITLQITYLGPPYFDLSRTIWASSLDGFLGTGPIIKVKLSVGEHIIDVYCGEFYQGFLIWVL